MKIVFLAKHETNLLIKAVSSKYFDTIIIYNNDFTTSVVYIPLYYIFYMFKKTSHSIHELNETRNSLGIRRIAPLV